MLKLTARILDSWRRWLGVFFLLTAMGMLIWGQTVLKSRLEGWGYIVYWLGCFLFTGLAMLTALIDFFIIRHRSREQQRTLIREAVQGIESEEQGQQRPEESPKQPKIRRNPKS